MCFLKNKLWSVYLHTTYILYFLTYCLWNYAPYSSKQTLQQRILAWCLWQFLSLLWIAKYYVYYVIFFFNQFFIEGIKIDINTMPFLTHFCLLPYFSFVKIPLSSPPMTPSQKIGPLSINPHPRSPLPFNLDVIIPFYYYSM